MNSRKDTSLKNVLDMIAAKSLGQSLGEYHGSKLRRTGLERSSSIRMAKTHI